MRSASWMSSRIAISIAVALGLPLAAQAQFGVEDEGGWGGEYEGRGGVSLSGSARQTLIPELYVVRRGDTLWDVTGRFYGNPWEWPRVWSYNPEITNPHWIYPLDQLRLLPPSEAGAPEPGQPSVRLVAPRRMPADTVFLRQEGYLDRDALESSGVVTGSPEEHMLLAPYDPVYVEFNRDYQGEPRGEMTIYREMSPGERAPGEQGTLVRIFGVVRIDSYDRDRRLARATIIEALDPIERGYRVAPMPRRFDMVPPQNADRDLVSHVVASLRPQQLLGQSQLVFLDVGGEQGVRMGNRFFVVRATDRWRASLEGGGASVGSTVEPPPPPAAYPAEIVAEGRVVDVRQRTCTLMITRSTREVEVGDRAELRRDY
ncbi:MAG: LysM peptidoglycan-binding domain-containing protein [Sandaracinaceae bacterium]|nr:LysM peptidoglycan-binding domain-containing protein [Sandaracinaceae bacterium]